MQALATYMHMDKVCTKVSLSCTLGSGIDNIIYSCLLGSNDIDQIIPSAESGHWQIAKTFLPHLSISCNGLAIDCSSYSLFACKQLPFRAAEHTWCIACLCVRQILKLSNSSGLLIPLLRIETNC